METPKRRAALGAAACGPNVTGRAERSHKPQATSQPATQQRSRRSKQAKAALAHAAPAEARSAQSIRREQGLGTWMNFIFAPGSASGTTGSATSSLHQVEQQRQETVLKARMAMLIRGAELGPLLSKVTQQVEDNFLRVRPPLNLTADVGLRDGLLGLLGCYNPIWLRLGLEAVTLESAPPHGGEADALVLRRFADHRVLQAPALQLSPPNGRHADEIARRAHARALDAAHKLILTRVLSTILVLDQAKEERLVPSDPCLFCPLAPIKSTALIVAGFGRGFLSGGVGNLAQHLGGLGAPLRHEQTALHEYDFLLRRPLAEEARDGARLCRLVELTALAGERQLVGPEP